jgi:hypothetical protein
MEKTRTETIVEVETQTSNVETVFETVDVGLIVGAIFGSIGGVLLIFGCWRIARRIQKAIAAQHGYEDWLKEQVEQALTGVNELGFSVCFVALSSLKKAGQLKSHEAWRNAGELKMMDTMDEVLSFVKEKPTIFLSHQWLSSDAPDPEKQHYHAIVRAVNMICEEEKLNEDEVYCWVDYASIPQANANMKQQSISTIALYASVCRYFVGVCPEITTTNMDQKVDYNLATYQERGCSPPPTNRLLTPPPSLNSPHARRSFQVVPT